MQDEQIAAMLSAVPDLQAGPCDLHQANGLKLPIFGINLDRRPDRWAALTRRFSQVGLDKVERAPAVDGRSLTRQALALFLGDADGADAAPASHLTLVRPAVGCFLSHLAVWKHVASSGLPYAMVLEDDAHPTAHFEAASLDAAIKALPQTGMIFPGCTVMSGLADRQAVNGLVRVFYFNGTFCYMVSAAACAFLLRHMLPMRMHVDHQLSHLLFDRRGDFPGYLMQPAAMQPDWGLGSDCVVDMSDGEAADREQRELFVYCRRVLESEGRMLRPDDTPASMAA